jgi:hypothetical protein
LLEVFLYGRTDEATTGSDVGITFNNTGGTSYARTRILEVGNGATFTGAAAVGSASLLATITGASAAANAFGTIRLHCPNFGGTVGFKEGDMGISNMDNTTVGNARHSLQAWQFASTSAISRMAIAPATAGKKLKVGSQLLIYKRLAS